MEIQDVQKLINNKKLKTPCYLFKRKKLINLIDDINYLIHTKFPNICLAYSLKTNSDEEVLKVFLDKNITIEVVSNKEYVLAKNMGFKKIIYNGPAKTKETFIDAIKNNYIINIENRRELNWIKSFKGPQQIEIGIRVNFPLSNFMNTKIIHSRFGFNLYEEFKEILKELKKYKNLKIVGLHYHVTNMEKSPEKFKIITCKLLQFARENKLKLKYIDIGGGFNCFKTSDFTFEDYMKEIFKCKEINKDIKIIIEPGYGLINSCYDYLTQIIDIKKTKQANFYLCDGSKLHLNIKSPINAFNVEFIKKTTVKEDKKNYIVGMSCMESDRLYETNHKLLLKLYDKILFKNCGAYTSSWISDFILDKPNIYVID